MITEKTFMCPRCSVGMKKIKRDNVILDICTKCGGMWLDHDEIPKLAEIANAKFKKG
ncbi:zf-TFIIB domain-containing protein [Candidatus Woesearchaeota archaeon]|nr:zf-TFIIB domain-containing protein [Candidatus Woesearchaeota archaeon]